MKKFLVAALIPCAILSSCAQKINMGNVLNQVNDVLNNSTAGAPLTEGDVSMGLKDALIQGITIGSNQASQSGGYFNNPLIKILLPPEVQKIESTLRSIGLGSQVDKFELSLNRGAENAASAAKPIFISAIKQLTITDAFNILRGEKDAATQFLRRTTTGQLTTAFEPILVKSLQEVSATKYYGDIANIYNQVPFVQKINPDLKGYATQKAIDGLFTLVAQEEAKIRENPIARTTEILKRVFGSQQ